LLRLFKKESIPLGLWVTGPILIIMGAFLLLYYRQLQVGLPILGTEYLMVFFAIGLPASWISTIVANKAFGQQASIREAFGEMVLRTIAFWLIFLVTVLFYNFIISYLGIAV
jgi:hypothetical protein